MDRREQRKELRKYLNRYYHAAKRLEILKQRFAAVQRQGNQVDRLLQIKVEQAQKEAEIILGNTTGIIGLLPNGQARNIIELRHLDFYDWPQIEQTVYLARSRAFFYYKQGLDDLLDILEQRKGHLE